jgi:hypothetical protein
VATGATYVEPDDMKSGDAPIHWQGELVGGVRIPVTGPAVSRTGEPSGAQDLTDLIIQVENELGGELNTLTRTKKQKAARLLEERGAFRFRGAAEDVAEAMGVSRVTVYNYLNAVRR